MQVYFDLWDEDLEVWEYTLTTRIQGNSNPTSSSIYFLFFSKFLSADRSSSAGTAGTSSAGAPGSSSSVGAAGSSFVRPVGLGISHEIVNMLKYNVHL